MCYFICYDHDDYIREFDIVVVSCDTGNYSPISEPLCYLYGDHLTLEMHKVSNFT